MHKDKEIQFFCRKICRFDDHCNFSGNSQGKMQPLGTLKGRTKEFLLEPFQKGKEIVINIRLPNGRGMKTNYYVYWFQLTSSTASALVFIV